MTEFIFSQEHLNFDASDNHTIDPSKITNIV